jgi:hypothetical protein
VLRRGSAEAPKTHDVPLPPINAVATPSPMAPDPRAIEAIADKLLKAEHPMLLPEYAGRRAGGFESIVEPAELTGSAVWDVNNALNFRTSTRLSQHGQAVAEDHRPDRRPRRQGLGKAAHRTEQRQAHPRIPAAGVVRFRRIGFAEVGISKWAMDYCRMQPCSWRARRHHLSASALIEACKQRIGSNSNLQKR